MSKSILKKLQIKNLSVQRINSSIVYGTLNITTIFHRRNCFGEAVKKYTSIINLEK